MTLMLPHPTFFNGLAAMSKSGRLGKEKVPIRTNGGEGDSSKRMLI